MLITNVCDNSLHALYVISLLVVYLACLLQPLCSEIPSLFPTHTQACNKLFCIPLEEETSPWEHKKEPLPEAELLSPDIEKLPMTPGQLEELRQKLIAYKSTFEKQADEIAKKNSQILHKDALVQQQSQEIGILQTEVEDLTKRFSGSQVTQTHGEATMDVDTIGMLHSHAMVENWVLIFFLLQIISEGLRWLPEQLSTSLAVAPLSGRDMV